MTTEVIADPAAPGVRAVLLVSAAFLAAQVSLTNYGDGEQGTAGGWFAFGLVLYALVLFRRSRVAWALAGAPALVGAALYLLSATGWPQIAIALCFLGQALPLLTPAVRRHVTRTQFGGGHAETDVMRSTAALHGK